MKFRNVVVATLVVGFIGGCAQSRYVMSEYDGVPKVTQSMSDGDYEIFDKSELSRLMIRTSHMIFSGEVGGKPYKSAVERYLSETKGRKGCEVNDGKVIYNKWWEFNYKCE